MRVFAVEDRDRVRQRVLELAAADERVVAGAVVGSLASGGGDRWSDLDLTFGVAGGHTPIEVLDDWTGRVVDELDAVRLFDLPSGAAIYRVFLLPGCLQLDLSFAPAASFGAGGPRFELLFGEAGDVDPPPPPSAQELFGYAVHHALRARFCIERGRVWQAEYWISGVRDHALGLACLARGLPARYGAGSTISLATFAMPSPARSSAPPSAPSCSGRSRARSTGCSPRPGTSGISPRR